MTSTPWHKQLPVPSKQVPANNPSPRRLVDASIRVCMETPLAVRCLLPAGAVLLLALPALLLSGCAHGAPGSPSVAPGAAAVRDMARCPASGEEAEVLALGLFHLPRRGGYGCL